MSWESAIRERAETMTDTELLAARDALAHLAQVYRREGDHRMAKIKLRRRTIYKQVLMMRAYTPPRSGVCSVCRDGWTLTPRGVLRKHAVTVPMSSPRWGETCAGSGQPPAEPKETNDGR